MPDAKLPLCIEIMLYNLNIHSLCLMDMNMRLPTPDHQSYVAIYLANLQ